LLVFPFVIAAVDIPQPTQDDKDSFKQLTEPIVKIYNLLKWIATTVAMVVLLIAGIMFMTSGYDPKKRDIAKSMAGYVLIGLFLIWAAPMLVNMMVGT
jgi:type IV secretory pathway VirB2 component (pilin)